MKITIRSYTLGSHTHLDLWINDRLIAEDMTLPNADVADFLARLRPEKLEDSTPAGHQRVAFA